MKRCLKSIDPILRRRLYTASSWWPKCIAALGEFSNTLFGTGCLGIRDLRCCWWDTFSTFWILLIRTGWWPLTSSKIWLVSLWVWPSRVAEKVEFSELKKGMENVYINNICTYSLSTSLHESESLSWFGHSLTFAFSGAGDSGTSINFYFFQLYLNQLYYDIP